MILTGIYDLWYHAVGLLSLSLYIYAYAYEYAYTYTPFIWSIKYTWHCKYIKWLLTKNSQVFDILNIKRNKLRDYIDPNDFAYLIPRETKRNILQLVLCFSSHRNHYQTSNGLGLSMLERKVKQYFTMCAETWISRILVICVEIIQMVAYKEAQNMLILISADVFNIPTCSIAHS